MSTLLSHKTLTATFAGGCFWCVESDFEKTHGVIEVISGYSGGKEVNPSYKEVSSGKTGHRETVQIIYDPTKTSYNELLNVFWQHIDPTDAGGQFVDRGKQYSSAIFYHNEEQKEMAEKSKRNLAKTGPFKKDIVTEIIPFNSFYQAEKYHQNYYKRNPIRYKFYRYRSGRDDFLKKSWKGHNVSQQKVIWHASMNSKYTKPSNEEIKDNLTPLQYKVTQLEETERPFNNEYWNNKKEGIYVDIISGEPLFSSRDKFKSGTGWPSFTQPLDSNYITEKVDNKLFMKRTEVRSTIAGSHLGHVFKDGPKPTGLRYCVNSASLKFIPKEELKDKGYEQYLTLFEK